VIGPNISTEGMIVAEVLMSSSMMRGGVRGGVRVEERDGQREGGPSVAVGTGLWPTDAGGRRAHVPQHVTGAKTGEGGC
jgi:hypothetical protein